MPGQQHGTMVRWTAHGAVAEKQQLPFHHWLQAAESCLWAGTAVWITKCTAAGYPAGQAPTNGGGIGTVFWIRVPESTILYQNLQAFNINDKFQDSIH